MNKVNLLLMASLMAASSLQVMAQDDEVPTAYGWLIGENWAAQNGQTERHGIASHPLSDPSDVTLVREVVSDYKILSAVHHDGLWYYFDYNQTNSGYESMSFSALDPETGDVSIIANYNAQAQGPTITSMVWDYSDQKMYGLNGFNAGNGLVSIDLETGDMTTVCLFMVDDNDPNDGYYQNQMQAIAVNYDGDMYALSYWGKLYKVNKLTGECKFIAKLSYIGEKTNYSGSALQYPGTNLFFDENTGKWYVEMYTYPYPSAGYELFMELNIQTGETTVIGTNVLGSDYRGLYVPFQIAGASAPAKVTDFTLTPGENGALEATLDWYNPAKTYGRGGVLMSIDSVVVYRDGEVIKTFTGVAPGEHMSFTDQVSESRFYNYRIQAFNEAGAGDRKALSAYIGHDIPKTVANLMAEVDNTADHKVTLSWTAPTVGIFDGWIDAENMTYRVVRSDGQTLVENLKETSYVDAPASIANYTYDVYAITPDGESKAATSEAVIAGPAITLPHTFTFSETEFPLWTVSDNNGDGIQWGLTSYYSSNCIYPGVYVSYSYYYGVAGADWLISPAIKFEANKHYKLSFDARTGSKSPECLAISMGQGASYQVQDSIDQFDFAAPNGTRLRTNLPVKEEDGEWNVGFYARSFYNGWQVSIGNVTIEEDHDGTLTGKVTDAETGEIVPLATLTLTASDGTTQQISTNPSTGVYTFKYVPAGEVSLKIERLGFADGTGSATITEYETTTADFTLAALPRHTVSGTVVDKVGEAVVGAAISLSGYNEYVATTDENGAFTLSNVMASENYNLLITSNHLLPYQAAVAVTEDVNAGTIVLEDNILAPASVSVELNEAGVPSLKWKNPVNDDVTLRYDSNILINSLGTATSSSYAVFGNIFRTPGLYRGAQFYLSDSGEKIWGLTLVAFDLDENGEPTPNQLATKYVSVVQGDWNNVTFDAPVNAPRGCYIAVQYYGFVGIGCAEATDSYPFVEHVSCYTGDYTSGQFFYLDDTDYKWNFMLRATVAPFDEEEPAQIAAFERTAADQAAVETETVKATDENLAAMTRINSMVVAEPAVKLNAIGDRTWFDLYRLTPATADNTESWTQLLEKSTAHSFTDEAIAELPMGTYQYAVRCRYVDDLTSGYVLSDTIGWQMHTTVTVKLNTNTETNEAEGAWVQIVNGGGVHAYGAYADENGEVVFENVWKANYDLYITLQGFGSIFEVVKFETEDAYTIERTLEETKVTPFGLKIINDDEEEMNNRLFVWNFPAQIYDSFEEHEAFAINSPGEVGWQYLDFDDPSEGTGYFNDMSYPNQGGAFAFQVFNLEQCGSTNYSYYFTPYSGKQMLTSWGNSTDFNWLVSPRLFFDEDFKISFAVKGYGYNTEAIEIGYTTSKNYADTASYQWIDYVPTYSWEIAGRTWNVPSYWTTFTADVPAEANFVTIRQVLGSYVLMIDDIRIGDLNAAPNAASARKAPQHRAPSLDGAYKVYLDGELVEQTDEKQYLFENLSNGYHTAGVISSYTSGETEMSTIEFCIGDPTQIESISSKAVETPAFDLYGRRVESGKTNNFSIQNGSKRYNR